MTRCFRSVFPFALAVATTCSTFAVGQETTQANTTGQSTSPQSASESQNSSTPQQDDSQADQRTGSQRQDDGDTSDRINSSQYADDDIRSSDAFNDSQQLSESNRSGTQAGQGTQDTDVQYGDSQNNDDAQRPQQRSQQRSQQFGNRQQDSWDQDSINYQNSGDRDDRDGAIGVQLEPQSQGNGVRVTGVYRNSPAAQAGIRVGDRILQVAGRAVTNAQDVVRAISQREPNQTLIMTIQSANGQSEDIALRLSSRAEELQGRMTQPSRGGGQMGSPMYQGSRNQGNPPIMQMLAEIRNELRQVRARLDSLEGRGRSTSYRQQQSGFNGGNTDANRNQRIENTYGNQQFDRRGITDDDYFDRQDDFYEDRNDVFDRNDAGIFDGERRSGFGNRRMNDE